MNRRHQKSARTKGLRGSRGLGHLFLVASIAMAGPHAALAETSLLFTEVTETAGLALPGTLNESVAWGDYDGDGDQDVYLTNNGPNRLFRNDGGDVFTDVTEAAGVGNDSFGVGAAFGDLDNDGDLDLYVVNFGDGADVLYRNNGEAARGAFGPTFTDITMDASTTVESSSRPIALVDYNRDGLLDIFVMSVGPNILYRNLGNLRFENVAPTLGIDDNFTGVGLVATDVNLDGWPDVFTGNRSFDPNALYLNDGGAFADISATAGIHNTGLGMGVCSFDYDNDLDFDLYWTTWPGSGQEPVPNSLYENQGANTFLDVAASTGTADPLGWGISCNDGDIDNDGWIDFFVTNGFSETTSANVLFRNDAEGAFEDVTSLIGGGAFDGRGVAFADYDDDGDQDLLVTGDTADLTRLWRNDTETDNHWITLDLVGVVSNRSAIGARIEVTTPARTTMREVSSGAGRGSFNSLPVEFGLGAEASIDQIRIFWPSGLEQVLVAPPIDSKLRVVEPSEDVASGGRRLRLIAPAEDSTKRRIKIRGKATEVPGVGLVSQLARSVRSDRSEGSAVFGAGSIAGAGNDEDPHDPRIFGGSLTISGGAGLALQMQLPARNWSVRGRGDERRFVYRDRAGADGPVAAAIVLLDGSVSVTARGEALNFDLPFDPGRVDATLRIGAGRYCLSFGGDTRFDPRVRFIAKDAPAPKSCPRSG